MSGNVRRLHKDDAAAFRQLRLECLQDYPHYFGSAYESELSQPIEFFEQRLSDLAVFGGFTAEQLTGVAMVACETRSKMQHDAVLVGMYVRPIAQGTGLAKTLVGTALDHAKTVAEQIHLHVTKTNEPARRLYESFGFTEFGLHPKALKVDGEYHDEILMILRFDEG